MSKIFNTKEINVYEMIDFIKNGIENEVPFVHISKGIFGGDTIMLLISFDPKSEWKFGYVENSNYFRMMVEDNGVIEEFTRSLYYKGVGKSFETRLKTKFRKCTVKSKEDVVRKIKDYINKVKVEMNGE